MISHASAATKKIQRVPPTPPSSQSAHGMVNSDPPTAMVNQADAAERETQTRDSDRRAQGTDRGGLERLHHPADSYNHRAEDDEAGVSGSPTVRVEPHGATE